MLHQPCGKKMLVRNVVCMMLGWSVMLVAIAEIRGNCIQGSHRFTQLQRLGWYGMVLKTNQ